VAVEGCRGAIGSASPGSELFFRVKTVPADCFHPRARRVACRDLREDTANAAESNKRLEKAFARVSRAGVRDSRATGIFISEKQSHEQRERERGER
jgi:hypothetical protein